MSTESYLHFKITEKEIFFYVSYFILLAGDTTEHYVSNFAVILFIGKWMKWTILQTI